MPKMSIPDRGIRYSDIAAAREANWLRETDDSSYSRLGDVFARGRYDISKSDLYRWAERRAPWWVKRRIETVRFRPYLTAVKNLMVDDGGYYTHDYHRGMVTIFYGSCLGRSSRQYHIPLPADGRHYLDIINDG